MISTNVKVTKKSKANAVKELLDKISRMQVYVGVPQEKTGRRGGKVNNAQLVFIHTNGSPIKGIPPRPIIEPAIESPETKQAIATELSQAADAVLKGNPVDAKKHLHRAGMRGSQAARNWFDDPLNGWPPDKPATVRAKLLKRIKSRKALAKALADYAAGNPDVNQTLIDTAQMKKSITYVVKE